VSVTASLARVKQQLDQLPGRIVRETADIARDELLIQAEAGTGGDRRLSRVTWMNFGLDVTIVYSAEGRDTNADLKPGPIFGGPAIWSWLEYGTKEHVVGLGNSLRYPQGRRRLRIDGNWITGPITVGGRPGEARWTRGVTDAQPKCKARAAELLKEALGA
jgi:hypothetical protein